MQAKSNSYSYIAIIQLLQDLGYYLVRFSSTPNARASATKNGKDSVIGLHDDVLVELRKLHEERKKPAEGKIFKSRLPAMKPFKKHFQQAGIAFIDAKGRRVDFHSLRHTLATNMALAGTAPRIAMEIMRHSNMRLTSKTYTDAVMLPVYNAITKLPSFKVIENRSQKTH